MPECVWIYDNRVLNMHHTYIVEGYSTSWWVLIERWAYSELSQRSKMECFGKIIIVFNYFCKKLHIKVACRVRVAYFNKITISTVFLNKLSRHVFNIVLKLNNHLRKKNRQINFLWKKLRPKSMVLQPRKKLQVLEKNFFWKSNSSSLYLQIWSSKWCVEIFVK